MTVAAVEKPSRSRKLLFMAACADFLVLAVSNSPFLRNLVNRASDRLADWFRHSSGSREESLWQY